MDVYFGSYFYDGENKKKKAGTEISVNKEFDWEGEKWKVLSLYDCKEGIVMDFCKEIEWEKMRRFYIKWKEVITGHEEDTDYLTEKVEQYSNENPSEAHVTPKMLIQGKNMVSHGGSSIVYCPQAFFIENGDFEEDCTDPVAAKIIKEYNLDSSGIYILFRWCFTWNNGWKTRKPKYSLSDIQVVMVAERINKTGENFHISKTNKRFSFINPVNQTEYQITFKEAVQQKVDETVFKQMKSKDSPEYHYPTCYEVITYTITPDLPEDSYYIQSKVKGDSPKTITGQSENKGAVSVSVIDKTDGPTSVFLAGNISAHYERSIISPLFFEPTEVRDYEIVFRVKPKEDICIRLG